MNIKNLKKMAIHMVTIDPNHFDIRCWRSNDFVSHTCDSIGCVIGHCVVLDDVNNIPYCQHPLTKPETPNLIIDFGQWSENFTGLPYQSEAWAWCFSSKWGSIDNTINGFVKRVNYLIKNNGIAPSRDHWKTLFEENYQEEL